MTKEIDALENHSIICGLGRMGGILARELHSEGRPFVVVDPDPHRLQEARGRGYLTVSGDATEEHVLDQAGIRRAGVLATVLSQDALNVFVTITAREMNPGITIIARGENPRTEKKLIGSGADKVVLPTAIGAKKLAQMIIRPSADHLLEQFTSQGDMNEELGRIGLRFDELEVTEGSELAGKSLSDIELRSNHGFLIVGVRGADGGTTMNPPPEAALAAGDVVIVLGHGDDLPQLAARFSSRPNKMTYRGVTIDSA